GSQRARRERQPRTDRRRRARAAEPPGRDRLPVRGSRRKPKPGSAGAPASTPRRAQRGGSFSGNRAEAATRPARPVAERLIETRRWLLENSAARNYHAQQIARTGMGSALSGSALSPPSRS